MVAFNVDDNKTTNARLSSVCQNLFQAGKEPGKKVADDIPPNITVLVTKHSEGISALEDRMVGIQSALTSKNFELMKVLEEVVDFLI